MSVAQASPSPSDPAQARARSEVGAVAAWEPELFDQARRFAAAYGRRFVAWPSGTLADARVDEVAGAASLTVFVSVRQLTLGMLDAIIQLSVRRGLSVGLVPCTPESQIPLVPPTAATAPALPRRSPLFSYFYAGHGIPGVADSYGRPAWEAFLAQAQRGAEAMILHTHGNGADAPFGEAILCARVDGRPASTRLARCLPCHAGGPCIREHHREFRWYFGPSYLRCHALILLSCTGFPPADSLLQYEGSLAHAMLRGGTIRTIVTSIRLAESTTLPLALFTKRFVEEGGSMGELALAINRADTRLPHYVCIGDPEHRPIEGPLEPGPIRDVAGLPPPDAYRAQKALVVLGEAELLARADDPPWPAIEARLRFVEAMARTPTHAPVDEPPSLVGARAVELERPAERVDDRGRCPSCEQATERYRSRSAVAREDLRLERCPAHGITAVDADVVVALDDAPASRGARWLFTALTLRQQVEQLESRGAEALEVARTLERDAFAADRAAPASRELDQRIASLFAAAVAAGGEAFLTRHLRYVSASNHGTTPVPHTCGQRLLYADLSPIPLRMRRRVWFCPLCGVAGNTLRELGLPEVAVEAGRWRATPMRAPFAADGCALSLAWEARGLHRDGWSTTRWIAEPTEGELPLAHRELVGQRHLNAIMVADAEVLTVRIPVLVSSPDRRVYSLRELNAEEHPAT